MAASAIESGQVCQTAGDAECVSNALQTAKKHLPELRRLVRLAMGLSAE